MSQGIVIGPFGPNYTLQANPVEWNYLLYSRAMQQGLGGTFALGAGALSFGYSVAAETYKPPLTLALSPIAFAVALETTTLYYNTAAALPLIGFNASFGGSSSLEYEGFRPWKNQYRCGRAPTTPGNSETPLATISAAGWPTQDFQQYLYTGNQLLSWATGSGGVFTCGYTSNGNGPTSAGGTEVIAGMNATISNIAYNSGTKLVTYDLVPTSATFGYKITGTTGGVTNCFNNLPAYPGTAVDDWTQPSSLTNEFVAWYEANGGSLRFMVASNAWFNTGLNTSATRNTAGVGGNTQTNKGWKASNQGQNYLGEGFPVEVLANIATTCNQIYWYNPPAWEDGANGSAGSYSTAVLTILKNTVVAAGGRVLIESPADELWNSATYPCGIGVGQTMNNLAVEYGFASSNTNYPGVENYIAYRMHTMATLCRSIFGAAFGTQVQLVLAWQQGSGLTNVAANMLAYMKTNYGNPGADIQWLATAPYINLNKSTSAPYNYSTTMTVAQIEANLQAVGAAQANTGLAESYSTTALYYGLLGLIAYEAPAWQVNSETAGVQNIGAAIMDPGMTATMQVVYNACLNAGFKLLNIFTDGVDSTPTSTSSYSPVDELSNVYPLTSATSPRMAAFQPYLSGSYTQTRNNVTIPGSMIPVGNYVDTMGGVPAFTNFSSIVVPYGVTYQANTAVARTASLTITASAPLATALIVNGVSQAIILDSSGTTVSIPLNAGCNQITIGSGSYSTVVLTGNLQF